MIAENCRSRRIMNLLVGEVSRHLHTSEVKIISRSRKREDCEARNLVYYVAHRRMGLSLTAIAEYMGRHHTSVERQIGRACKTFPDAAQRAVLLGDNVDRRLNQFKDLCPRCNGTGVLTGGVKR